MKYRDPEAFRSALEARLRATARSDQDLARQRRTVAFDRFLARLAVANHRSWVLKGGAAIEFRIPDRARSTRDIDLAFVDESDPLECLLNDLAGDPFGDFFSFRVTRQRKLSGGPDRGAVLRLSLDAIMGARVFERFLVDIVTGERTALTTERVELGHILDIAELPVVAIAVIDVRTHWAEKLSAYLRRFAERPNTRVKDLVDLLLLIEHGLEPDADLCLAVEATFERRGQQLPLSELPSMADAWAEPFAALAEGLGLETQIASNAHLLVEEFWGRAQLSKRSAEARGGLQEFGK